MKNKHLSLEDRHKIENGLNDRLSFKEIGKLIDKDCTSISREVRNHYIVKNTGCFGKGFNNCSKVKVSGFTLVNPKYIFPFSVFSIL